jgi:TonB family protein
VSPIVAARSIEWEGDEVRGSAAPLAYSFASHLVVLGLLVLAQIHRPVGASDPEATLGYWDRSRRAGDLDLRQRDALRFRFFQPPTTGGAGARGAERRDAEARPRAAATTQVPRADGARAARPRSTADAATPRSDTGDAAAGASADDGVSLPALQPDVALSDRLVITKLVKPSYPDRELQQGISADVLVALHVTPLGEIDEAHVQESRTDPPASPRAFELTALEALRQWRIRLPATGEYRQGCWIRVPVEYRPRDKDFERFEPAIQTERAPAPDS